MVIPKREDPMSLAFEMAAVNNSILALVNPHNDSLHQHDENDEEDESNDDQQSTNAPEQRKQNNNNTMSELKHEEIQNKRDFRMYSS